MATERALYIEWNPAHCTLSIPYPIVYTDAGRSQSHRPKQSNDCTVRAFALACKLPYDTIYDLFAADGRKCGRGFNVRRFLTRGTTYRATLDSLHCESIEWQSFPAVKGQRRMTPVQFCREFSSGRYICKTAKHVFAVIDGCVYDTEPVRADRCIYGAWRIS